MKGERPTVCILAAGRGTRLGDLTATLPKSLLDVGGGTIVDHQLAAIAKAGFPDESIRIVTGHAEGAVRDRFGDQGLIGVAILRTAGEEAIIDTFLMSCRVMNRQVEQALMSYLLEHARRLQCARVIGAYIPTKKNRVVERFYADFGFQLVATTGESRRYVLPLDQDDVSWPEVIRREPPARAQPR